MLLPPNIHTHMLLSATHTHIGKEILEQGRYVLLRQHKIVKMWKFCLFGVKSKLEIHSGQLKLTYLCHMPSQSRCGFVLSRGPICSLAGVIESPLHHRNRKSIRNHLPAYIPALAAFFPPAVQFKACVRWSDCDFSQQEEASCNVMITAQILFQLW